MMENPLYSIREAKHNKRLRWTREALKRSIERNIPVDDVCVALNAQNAEILRNAPTDKSPSCLVLGWDDRGKAIHTVVAYHRMLVITVYEPKPPKYTNPRGKGV